MVNDLCPTLLEDPRSSSFTLSDGFHSGIVYILERIDGSKFQHGKDKLIILWNTLSTALVWPPTRYANDDDLSWGLQRNEVSSYRIRGSNLSHSFSSKSWIDCIAINKVYEIASREALKQNEIMDESSQGRMSLYSPRLSSHGLPADLTSCTLVRWWVLIYAKSSDMEQDKRSRLGFSLREVSASRDASSLWYFNGNQAVTAENHTIELLEVVQERICHRPSQDAHVLPYSMVDFGNHKHVIELPGSPIFTCHRCRMLGQVMYILLVSDRSQVCTLLRVSSNCIFAKTTIVLDRVIWLSRTIWSVVLWLIRAMQWCFYSEDQNVKARPHSHSVIICKTLVDWTSGCTSTSTIEKMPRFYFPGQHSS